MGEYLLLTARPPAEAQIIVGALRAEGLRARYERNAMGAVYGLTSGGFGAHVLVHFEDFAAALQLLNDIEDQAER